MNVLFYYFWEKVFGLSKNNTHKLCDDNGIQPVFKLPRALKKIRLIRYESKWFFLNDIEKLQLMYDEILRNHCADLVILLKDGENSDVNGIVNELKHFFKKFK